MSRGFCVEPAADATPTSAAAAGGGGTASSRKPRPGDRVLVHYDAWVWDGAQTLITQYASTRTSTVAPGASQPLSFVVGAGQLLRGMEEGVQALSVGERATLTITPALGYGDTGLPLGVPPRSHLVFDLELVHP